MFQDCGESLLVQNARRDGSLFYDVVMEEITLLLQTQPQIRVRSRGGGHDYPTLSTLISE